MATESPVALKVSRADGGGFDREGHHPAGIAGIVRGLDGGAAISNEGNRFSGNRRSSGIPEGDGDGRGRRVVRRHRRWRSHYGGGACTHRIGRGRWSWPRRIRGNGGVRRGRLVARGHGVGVLGAGIEAGVGIGRAVLPAAVGATGIAGGFIEEVFHAAWIGSRGGRHRDAAGIRPLRAHSPRSWGWAWVRWCPVRIRSPCLRAPDYRRGSDDWFLRGR